MFGKIGPTELIVILAILLLVMGPRRLPELARSIGRGIKEFRGGLKEAAEQAEEAGAGPAGGATNAATGAAGREGA